MTSDVNDETYNLLVKAYRAHPENHKAASEAVGCSWRTAKRAWELGWPQRGFEPIKDFSPTKEYLERIALIKDENVAIEKLRANGGLASEWLKMLERGRADLDGLMRSIARITPSVEILATQAASQLRVEAPGFDASKALTYIMRFAEALKTVTQVAAGWQQIERIAAEKPTQIVGVQHELPAEMTFEEAEARIKAAAQAIDVARRKASAIDVTSENLTESARAAVKPGDSNGQDN
jgi:hypothetical protein